jgi:4-amino-4-deoxy-L-arabinose transferase-like glycosyltransferase
VADSLRALDASVDPGPRAAPRDLWASAAVFLAALLPRLYVAIAWAREPVWDGHYYDFGARRIAAGLGYSDDVVGGGQPVWHPWCHYPVGYSAFLGGVYRVFGSGPHVATIANAVVGALLAVVVHRLARHATGELRAFFAGLLVALWPGLVVYAALLMTEPLAALGLATSAWLVARDGRAHPRRGALAGGVALGLTALVRPQSLLVAPALGLFTLPAGAPRRARLLAGARTAGLALLAALAVIAPWTARNCRVMDGCALVSTNGGWNLAIGAFPRATGRFETLRATDGCPIVTGQVQQDRCWRDEGLRWIAADPRRWLGLVPKKLAETFDHESFPMGYLGEADPAAWPEARKAKGRELLTSAHRALMVLAALGVVGVPWARKKPGEGEDEGGRAERRWLAVAVQGALLALALGLAWVANASDKHPYYALAIFIPVVAALRLPGAPARGRAVGYAAFTLATVAVTHAVFFGEDRYHVVATPMLCLLAACALRRSDERAAVDAPRARRLPAAR